MKREKRNITSFKKSLIVTSLLTSLGIITSSNAHAVIIPSGGLVVDTELTNFDLAGPNVAIPLARDPSNLLGDSIDGYGFVNSSINLTLSSQRTTAPGPASTGTAYIYPSFGEFESESALGYGGDYDVQQDDLLYVDSFFDVFFDITVTDVDSRTGRDFAGQVDGSSISILDNGPASMSLFTTCQANLAQVNFGCLPPVGDAYIGHFDIVIPLGGDINGNGFDDVMKFTLGTHNVGSITDFFIDGDNAFDTFNTTLVLDGLIQDAITDPPFTISLSGPTTAKQQIVVASVPEPGSLALFGAGLALIGLRKIKSSKRKSD